MLLAISTTPPTGLATTPINPLPIPLKNPPAPSFLAPKKKINRVLKIELSLHFKLQKIKIKRALIITA